MKLIFLLAFCCAATLALPTPPKFSHRINPLLSFAEKNYRKLQPLRERNFIRKLLVENPVGLKEVVKQLEETVEGLYGQIDIIAQSLVVIIRNNDLQNELEEKLPSIVADYGGGVLYELIAFVVGMYKAIGAYWGQCEFTDEDIISTFISLGAVGAALYVPAGVAGGVILLIEEISPSAFVEIEAVLLIILENVQVIVNDFTLVLEQAFDTAFPPETK